MLRSFLLSAFFTILEQAAYQLIIPLNTTINRFSIPPGDSITTDGEKVYYWSEKNFMPIENMVFDYIIHNQ
jgi:hypothetical protein